MAAMERTRIAKVEDVILLRRGESVTGTLHLTPHHLIFVHLPSASAQQQQQQQPQSSTATTTTDKPVRPIKPRELWITYPIISLCTLRPSHPTSRQPSSIRLRCRDFTYVCFYFMEISKARDVYESIKAWTCKLGRIDRLYAFAYQPQGPEKGISDKGRGWALYDPMKEWRRMGIGSGGGGNNKKGVNWRISTINTDYAFSPTYPALLPVPANITDNTLNYAAKYRSRARIPVLTYLHPVNQCSITRCSQPMLGVRQHRSIQDEKLLAAIFSTTRNDRPLSGFVTPNPLDREDSGSSANAIAIAADPDVPVTSTEAFEDAVISKLRGDHMDEDDANDDKRPMVYGAQQKNMIVDARPTVNAYAMQAVGMGSENMENYKFATKVYLGIDNIHVMRESLSKVVDALKDSDLTPLGPSREQLAKSGWLKHIANMLEGVGLIVRQVGLQHSHVLIHCSDGWDRTSQLSALSQICLDPYYRTFEGFIVLVEKDWLSFGHMFRYRTGFLSSDKWFVIENERVGGRDEEGEGKHKGRGDAMSGAQKTFENAFLSAKGFFTKQHNDSRESINVDSDADPNDSDVAGRRVATGPLKSEKAPVTKVKETAPIFHQFLDATYQLMQQYPTRFEFSDRFLRRLLYHLYSCQYGTFLFDNEKDRQEFKIKDKTRSVWDYFLARKQEFLNASYDPEVNDKVRGKERLIFPRTAEVRWWASVFGRTDEEMNGPVKSRVNTGGDEEMESSGSFVTQSLPTSQPVSRARTPVLIGVETSEVKVGVANPAHDPLLRESTAKTIDQVAIAKDDGDLDTPMPSIGFADNKANTTDEEPQIEVIPADSNKKSRKLNGTEVKGSQPESANEQKRVIIAEAASTTGETSESNELDQQLADGFDPLGIGDVKDHVTTTTKKTGQYRRKAQMEKLMQ